MSEKQKNKMKEYTTDGHVVTNGNGYMGIFSAVSLLNDVVKVNENLKQQLADAEKVIDEVTSRSVYTYSNTQCKSAKERVIKIAKLCERYKKKYKKY